MELAADFESTPTEVVSRKEADSCNCPLDSTKTTDAKLQGPGPIHSQSKRTKAERKDFMSYGCFLSGLPTFILFKQLTKDRAPEQKRTMNMWDFDLFTINYPKAKQPRNRVVLWGGVLQITGLKSRAQEVGPHGTCSISHVEPYVAYVLP